MVLALKYKKAIHWLHENSYISIILDGEIIIHNCFGLLDYNNLLEMLNYFLLLYFN